MSATQESAPQLPRKTMAAVALAQGIALFLLYRATENQVWPSQTPAISFPLWMLAVVWPTALLLSVDKSNLWKCLQAVSFCTGLLAIYAVYIGSQAAPLGAFPINSLLFVAVVTGLIACFLGLLYYQQWIGQIPLAYESLFVYCWRNFLIVGLAAALTIGVTLILFLWGALFAVIGIDFFQDLFSKDWFLFPVLASAFGLGVLIFRLLAQVIDNITRLMEGLMRLLLPLIAAVTVIFIAALPFTGLTPLWETGSGTALLLWLNALALFFVNGVYQTGRELPYPPLVHRALSVAIALLPVVSALALYGLYLRIADYGFTVARYWAFVAFLILALFSGGYAWFIVWKRAAWPEYLGGVNTAISWLLLVLMLCANSPILDFRAKSLDSQLARVAAGEIELRDLDFHYVKHHLARPGYLKMQALIEEFVESDPELVELIQKPTPNPYPDRLDADELWRGVVYRPESFRPPAELRAAVRSSPIGPLDWYEQWYLLRVDLNDDGQWEYVFLAIHREHDDVRALQYYRDDDGWHHQDLAMSHGLSAGADIREALSSGDIEVVAPRFGQLQVGALLFRQVQ